MNHSIITPSYDSLEYRLHCLKQYGDFTLAYATKTDPLLGYFCDPYGYIAYRQFWGYTYVLGDPIAPRDRWPDLVGRFLDKFPRSLFCQISPAAAQCLLQHRYWVNEMGVDSYLELDDYNFNGKHRAGLRYAANWLGSHGYRVEERDVCPSLKEQMKELIAAWHATRVNKREVVFLNRPAILDDEEDVRKFFLINPSGNLEAFLFFDPLYRNGKIIGYVTSVKRRHPSATSYAELGICKRAIEIFQSEGIQLLRLGLSPLANIENRTYRHVKPLHYTWRYFHQAAWVNRFVYNFKGHAAFKRRFGGTEEKMHFASPVFINDLRIIGWLRMMRLI